MYLLSWYLSARDNYIHYISLQPSPTGAGRGASTHSQQVRWSTNWECCSFSVSWNRIAETIIQSKHHRTSQDITGLFCFQEINMCHDLVVIAIVAVVVKVVVTVNVLCIVVLSSNDLCLRVLFACIIRHVRYYSHKSNNKRNPKPKNGKQHVIMAHRHIISYLTHQKIGLAGFRKTVWGQVGDLGILALFHTSSLELRDIDGLCLTGLLWVDIIHQLSSPTIVIPRQYI